MLSRVAENFYWIGRYIERANNTVSLLDVTYLTGLEERGKTASSNLWESLITVNQGMEFFREFYNEANMVTVHAFLLFSADNPSSIYSSVGITRDNLRAVRNRVSTPMWIVVNEFYLWLKSIKIDDVISYNVADFYRKVRSFCLAFFGACDNTLMHDETWQFVKLGRALERALETASILDLKYHLLLESIDDVGKAIDMHQWQTLLRSVDGLEAYVNTYMNRIDPATITEMLILNRRFPKSVMFNLREIRQLVLTIPHQKKSTAYWLLKQQTEGVLAELGSTSIPAIFEMGFHDFLQTLIKQTESLNRHFYQTYFGYVEEQEQ